MFDLIRGHATNARAVLCAFDLLEVNGDDIRAEPFEDRKRRLAGLLRLPHDGIALTQAIQRRRRDDLQTRLRARLRGHRVQAARLAIPCRPLGALAQNQEPGRTRCAAARRRRLDLMADRRFPPPWMFEEANGACFVIKDANGFAMSYVYYEAGWEAHRRQPDPRGRSSPDRRLWRCQSCSAPHSSRKQTRLFTGGRLTLADL